MWLLNKINYAYRRWKTPTLDEDISGYRLVKHLKNMDLDANIISESSGNRWSSPQYKCSIWVKEENIDVIQIMRYEDFSTDGSYYYSSYEGYRIDYIILGFERENGI